MDLEWRPILEGELATKAQARIAQIGAALDLPEHAEPPRDTDPTLAEGHTGIALFVATALLTGGLFAGVASAKTHAAQATTLKVTMTVRLWATMSCISRAIRARSAAAARAPC